MNSKLSILAAAALAAVFTAAQAQPQPATTPKTPKGELSTATQDRGSASRPMATASRQDVKNETRAAAANGEIPKGEQSTPNQGKKPPKAMSNTSRAEVKADAAAANKAGQVPTGERAMKDEDKGGNKGTKP